MRKTIWPAALLGVILAAGVALPPPGAAEPKSPESVATLLEAAKKDAKSSNRTILVLFGASW
jgi:hypothetical protein